MNSKRLKRKSEESHLICKVGASFDVFHAVFAAIKARLAEAANFHVHFTFNTTWV